MRADCACRCVDIPAAAGAAIPFRACATGQAGAGQRLKIVKTAGTVGGYLLTIGTSCVYGTFPNPISSGRCLTRGDPLFLGQRYGVDTEPSERQCKAQHAQCRPSFAAHHLTAWFGSETSDDGFTACLACCPTGCSPIRGFTARAYVRPTLTAYNTSKSENLTELAAACAADCKCQ